MAETVGQLIGFVALAIIAMSLQIKSSRNFFAAQTIGCMVFTVHFLMLSAYTGAVLNFIGALNFGIYYLKEKGIKFADKSFWLYVFCGANIAASVVFTIISHDFLNLLPGLAMGFNTWSRFDGKFMRIRIFQICAVSPLWITYDFLSKSYPGVLTELLVTASAVIAIIRYCHSNKNYMIVKAYAKINPVLSVGKKREDGYHNLSMLMQTIDICDFIKIRKAKKISVRTDTGINGTANICYKAAQLFSEFGGAEIRIKKYIPVCAGFGGGSTDAAAVLRALNKLYGEPFSADELKEKALSLGSDVPFFLKGGTARVEGKGELIRGVMPLSCWVVILLCGKKQSTAKMYEMLDGASAPSCDDCVPAAIKSIQKHDFASLGENLFNSFEAVVNCDEEKKDLVNCGAFGALLCGSGPSVFGFFEDAETAQACADSLKTKYDRVYACKTSEKSATFE